MKTDINELSLSCKLDWKMLYSFRAFSVYCFDKNLIIMCYFYRVTYIDIQPFANSLGDQGSIPSQVILKAQKMALETSLPNTQHYKVWVKGK